MFLETLAQTLVWRSHTHNAVATPDYTDTRAQL